MFARASNVVLPNNIDIHVTENLEWWTGKKKTNMHNLVNLWRKVICLFCFVCTYEIHRTRMLQIACLVCLETSCGGGVAFSWRLDLQCRSSWILNDSSTENKLNHSWKFRRNWNVPLVMLERSWWAGFNGIYLVRFGFRMWEILIFKWFLLLKIIINSKNQVFEGKVSWGRVHTWANGTGHTSVS